MLCILHLYIYVYMNVVMFRLIDRCNISLRCRQSAIPLLYIYSVISLQGECMPPECCIIPKRPDMTPHPCIHNKLTTGKPLPFCQPFCYWEPNESGTRWLTIFYSWHDSTGVWCHACRLQVALSHHDATETVARGIDLYSWYKNRGFSALARVLFGTCT